jgi:glucose/arabinose dehydrogenase
MYISTIDFAALAGKPGPVTGIIALHPGNAHADATITHFGTVVNGTGIGFYKGALYAASPTAITRYQFAGHELVPSAAPQTVLDGMPTGGSPNRGLAFDGKGGLFVSVAGSSNACADEKAAVLKGAMPCPELNGRAGIWRFDAGKTDQKFPSDGEQVATGVRDMQALEWSREHDGLYAAMQGRNAAAHALGLAQSNTADDDFVAEEMHRVDKGADLGWPYTYYDRNLKLRVMAPEYGGDGKTAPTQGHYSTPVVAFPAHSSPLDIAFYDGRQFPHAYRGGAFVVFHGGLGPNLPEGHRGYDVKFVPFDKAGKAGTPQDFIEGFAGPDASYKNAGKAIYRPVGAAVGPDGALYVVDQNKGRVWRISYDGKGK